MINAAWARVKLNSLKQAISSYLFKRKTTKKSLISNFKVKKSDYQTDLKLTSNGHKSEIEIEIYIKTNKTSIYNKKSSTINHSPNLIIKLALTSIINLIKSKNHPMQPLKIAIHTCY